MGDEAAYQNDFDSALGYYKLARTSKDTPEISDLIKKTEKKVKPK